MRTIPVAFATALTVAGAISAAPAFANQQPAQIDFGQTAVNAVVELQLAGPNVKHPGTVDFLPDGEWAISSWATVREMSNAGVDPLMKCIAKALLAHPPKRLWHGKTLPPPAPIGENAKSDPYLAACGLTVE